MDNGLLALKLVLEGLGVEASVDDFDKRLMMQKAVYLGQRLGVDLGYRFSWYRRGPYSSALADDYFRLCSAGEQSADDRKLHPKVAERLKAAQRLLVPKDEMEPPDWAELVASLDYLLKVDGYEFQNAKKVLQDTRPELAEAADDARKRLEEAGLVVRVGKQWLTAPTQRRVVSHRLWLEVEGPEQRCIHSCVYRRADLEALAELVAKALAALPEEDK